MSLFLIKRKDGGVSVMRLIEGVSPEAEVAKWPAMARDQVVSITPCSEADLPQERSFRNAWTHDGVKVSVDMAKARDIHRDRLREARLPQLEELDVQYLKALEVGDQRAMQAIAAEKQALRDLTADPAIEAARTPEELKAVVPSVLL